MKTILKIIFLTVIMAILFPSAGNAESRIKIGVIDTGIKKSWKYEKSLCNNGRKSLVHDLGYDNHGHGSNIAGIIAEKINNKTHCIISYKVFANKRISNYAFFGALRAAKADRVKLVNISISDGPFWQKELELLRNLTHNNITVVVAAGNRSMDLDMKCSVYPTCYRHYIKENFYVIGSYSGNYSNEGRIVDFKVDGTDQGIPKMSGTSQAAAVYSSMLMSK